MRPPFAKSPQGHSLVELITVMAVVGLLATAAAVRFQQPSGQSLTLQTEQLRRHVSQIQMLAISRSQRIQLSAQGSQYAVQVCESVSCTAPTPLTDPATGRPFIITLQNGAQIGSAALVLDSLGRPASAAGVVTTDPAIRFELSLAGRTTAVDVAPLTGTVRTTY